MNRKHIIAELRRSATEDADPWCGVDRGVFYMLGHWRETGEFIGDKSDDFLRLFFLIVAAAMV